MKKKSAYLLHGWAPAVSVLLAKNSGSNQTPQQPPDSWLIAGSLGSIYTAPQHAMFALGASPDKSLSAYSERST
jgi:hypothetical protein